MTESTERIFEPLRAKPESENLTTSLHMSYHNGGYVGWGRGEGVE